jgi:hypothetical protein
VASLLRLIAVCLSLVVAIGFILFAVDEMNRGSRTQQQAVAQATRVPDPTIIPPSPTPADEAIREREHGKVREAIDDANDELLMPFAGIVSSHSNWVTHGVPALMALLVYGFGLGLLANMLPKATTGATDWRTA